MIIVDTVLKYALAGTTAAGLGWGAYEAWWVVPSTERDRDAAKTNLAAVQSAHDRMVKDNAVEVARLTEANREHEQQTASVITGLLIKGKQDAETIAVRDRAVADARRLRDDAQGRYLAAVAAAAAANPGAACRAYGAAAELLGQLHRETDGLAEEASRAADAAASQLARLQTYVTDVCLKPLPAVSQPVS